MRAAVVREHGGLEAIEINNSYQVPLLVSGSVLVQNHFSGLNFIDTYHRSGLYKRDMPFVLGQEAAGVITELSPEAEALGWSKGDRVVYSTLQTYSEVSAVPASASKFLMVYLLSLRVPLLFRG